MCSDTRPAAESISAIDVRREIWRSLLSMVRVYAGLEGLRRQESAEFIEPVLDSATVELRGVRLELFLDIESGWGEWRVAAEAGEFAISDSGLLHVERQQKELDIAAMEWLEKLSSQRRQPHHNGQRLQQPLQSRQPRP